jgi:hypothetical protein
VDAIEQVAVDDLVGRHADAGIEFRISNHRGWWD